MLKTALSSSLSNSQPKHQLKLYGNEILADAGQSFHIVIADFIHSNALPFSLEECPKFRRILEVARNLGPNYTPPDR